LQKYIRRHPLGAGLICSLVQIDAICWPPPRERCECERASEPPFMTHPMLLFCICIFLRPSDVDLHAHSTVNVHTIELQNDLWSGDKHLLTDAFFPFVEVVKVDVFILIKPHKQSLFIRK